MPKDEGYIWEYVYKWRKEIIWAIGAALAGVIYDFAMVSGFNPRVFADPVWLGDQLVPAAFRAVLGALFALFTGGFRPPVPVGPRQPTIDERVDVDPRARGRPEMPE